MKMILATHNRDKCAEMTAILGKFSIELLSLDDFPDINEIVEDGNTLEGARVTLLMGDDVIFTTGLTDDHGQIVLNWEAIESGTMHITVIKRNHRPYESTIEISSAAGAAAGTRAGAP